MRIPGLGHNDRDDLLQVIIRQMSGLGGRIADVFTTCHGFNEIINEHLQDVV